MKITYNKETGELSYNIIEEVEKRDFDTYQYYGPIPKSEVLRWSNLKQNKGWR
jgi:hypothetical protein